MQELQKIDLGLKRDLVKGVGPHCTYNIVKERVKR